VAPLCGCLHELSGDYVFALSCMSWYWHQWAASLRSAGHYTARS